VLGSRKTTNGQASDCSDCVGSCYDSGSLAPTRNHMEGVWDLRCETNLRNRKALSDLYMHR
jgi:hypothetical protein